MLLGAVGGRGSVAATLFNPRWTAGDKSSASFIVGVNAATVLTINQTTTGTEESARCSTTPALSGKCCFAMQAQGTYTSVNLACGFADSSFVLANTLGGDTHGVGVAIISGGSAGGVVTCNGATLCTLPLLGATGVAYDEIVFAVDVANKLLWVSANGGIWNNSATANPATGVGGVSISALAAGSFYPTMQCFNGGGTAKGAIVLAPPALVVLPAGFALL